MNRSSTISLALATFWLASGASAAEPAADAVPKELPFDIPYGEPVTLERADAVLTAAVAEAKSRSWKNACAVVDSGGNLVSFKRMDNTQLGSIDIAIHKARAAVKFRRETKLFEDRVQGGGNSLLTLDDIIASRGGVPLIEGGKIIGAIGCSGGTSTQDELVAKAGVAAKAATRP